MKLKRYLLFILFGLLCLIPSAVKADVIFEPDNDFYRDHSSDCTHEGRNYTADMVDGTVVLYKSPDSKKEIASYEKGTRFYIAFIYLKDTDKAWGYTEIDQKSGWIPMDRLTLDYDNISFEADHKGEFQPYNDEFDYDINAPIVFWTYPGSGEILNRFDKMENIIKFNYTYKDENGKLWGYTGTYRVGGWVYFSDQAKDDIPAVKKKSDNGSDDTDSIGNPNDLSSRHNYEFILLIILVTSVIIITAIIIRTIWKNGGNTKK